MTRGAQRDRNRERAQARADKNGKKEGSSAYAGNGAINTDAVKLQEKIAMKEKLKAEGLMASMDDKKKTDKPKNMVNPHTGKKDPDYTKKMLAKTQ